MALSGNLSARVDLALLRWCLHSGLHWSSSGLRRTQFLKWVLISWRRLARLGAGLRLLRWKSLATLASGCSTQVAEREAGCSPELAYTPAGPLEVADGREVDAEVSRAGFRKGLSARKEAPPQVFRGRWLGGQLSCWFSWFWANRQGQSWI